MKNKRIPILLTFLVLGLIAGLFVPIFIAFMSTSISPRIFFYSKQAFISRENERPILRVRFLISNEDENSVWLRVRGQEFSEVSLHGACDVVQGTCEKHLYQRSLKPSDWIELKTNATCQFNESFVLDETAVGAIVVGVGIHDKFGRSSEIFTAPIVVSEAKEDTPQ